MISYNKVHVFFAAYNAVYEPGQHHAKVTKCCPNTILRWAGLPACVCSIIRNAADHKGSIAHNHRASAMLSA